MKPETVGLDIVMLILILILVAFPIYNVIARWRDMRRYKRYLKNLST